MSTENPTGSKRLTGSAASAETLLLWIAQRSDTARRRGQGETQEAWVKRLANNHDLIDLLGATRDVLVTIREEQEGITTQSLVEKAEEARREADESTEEVRALREELGAALTDLASVRADLGIAQAEKDHEVAVLTEKVAEAQGVANGLRNRLVAARGPVVKPRISRVPVLPRAAL